MGFNPFLRLPKQEEQEVPDTELSIIKEAFTDEHADFMADLFSVEEFEVEDERVSGNNNFVFDDSYFNWGDVMKCDEFADKDSYSTESSEEYHNKLVKREACVGAWDEDDDDKKVALNLNLNYEDVLEAWSDRGSLWANNVSPILMMENGYLGEVPVMEKEKTRREESVLRYKEKRQSRLFSKNIRYQVRKVNADQRPRLKGRFVKRVP